MDTARKLNYLKDTKGYQMGRLPMGRLRLDWSVTSEYSSVKLDSEDDKWWLVAIIKISVSGVTVSHWQLNVGIVTCGAPRKWQHWQPNGEMVTLRPQEVALAFFLFFLS